MTMTETVLPDGYIPAVEAGERLELARQRIYQLIKTQDLPAMRHNGQWYVSEAAVDKRLADRATVSTCVSTVEVLEFFGIYVRTLYRWINEGKIHPIKVAGRLCYDLDEVVNLVPAHVGRTVQVALVASAEIG